MRIASSGFDRDVYSVANNATPDQIAPLISLDPPFEPYCGLPPDKS
jgi:hypothetical protein